MFWAPIMNNNDEKEALIKLIKDLIGKLDELKVTVSTVVVQQQENKRFNEDINEKISDPDNGIHKKINDLFNEIKTLKEYEVKSIKENIEKDKNIIIHEVKEIKNQLENNSKDTDKSLEELNDNIEKTNDRIEKLEDVSHNLIKISGSERLENLDSAVKLNQNSKKILWVFIVGTLSVLIEKLF